MVLALAFFASGLVKLAGIDPMPADFARWGYPPWFMIAVGAVELASGVLLLVPRLAFHAALTLGVVMLGAIATHVVHRELGQALVPLALLANLSVLATIRMPTNLRERVRDLWAAHSPRLRSANRHA